MPTLPKDYRFLEQVLSNRVLNGQTVEFDLRKPLQVLAEMKKTEEWRPERSSERYLLFLNLRSRQ